MLPSKCRKTFTESFRIIEIIADLFLRQSQVLELQDIENIGHIPDAIVPVTGTRILVGRVDKPLIFKSQERSPADATCRYDIFHWEKHWFPGVRSGHGSILSDTSEDDFLFVRLMCIDLSIHGYVYIVSE